jgi:hypothetical protein
MRDQINGVDPFPGERAASPDHDAPRDGDPADDIGALVMLASRLADRLLELRGPPVHALRLARGMALNIVDVLEAHDAAHSLRSPLPTI